MPCIHPAIEHTVGINAKKTAVRHEKCRTAVKIFRKAPSIRPPASNSV